jgi:ADP-L-glycero-D-manno-heptose 6-epimerase
MTAAELELNGRSVLVTGGAGFIGSNLALSIQSRYPDCRVVVLDRFDLGHFRNLRGFQGEVLAGDVSRPEDLKQLAGYRFDAVFHQAAISDTTVDDQERMLRVNTNSIQWIVEMAQSMSAAVVYASSAGTYGNSPPPNRVGQGEEPENVYGFSKLMMDQWARRAMRTASIPIAGLRYFNVYGPRESFKGTTASMILQLGLQLLAGRRPRLFKWGEQSRDFVYVDDVVEANLGALAAGTSGIFNVGSGTSRSFNDVLAILARQFGVDIEPEYIDNPWPFYQDHTLADIEATRTSLGYRPGFTLEEGIAAYVPEIRRLAGKDAVVGVA